MNLAENLERTAREHPDNVAMKLDDVELTYRQLDGAATRVANLLTSKGLEAGDRVGIMLPNVPYFAACYYGVLRMGGVVVPMNVLLKKREVGFYLADPEAKALFAWHDFAEAAEAGAEETDAELILVEPGEFEQLVGEQGDEFELVERDDDDTAVILYTSGTTGKPKGAELTHGNLTRNVEIAGSLFDMRDDAVLLGALPLFHSFGQTCAMNCAISRGATLTLLPRFDPGKALEIIGRDKVTVFQGVPTMYAAMLNHPDREGYDTSCLEVCASGGSAMPVEVMRGFEEAFGCKVLEGYGLSETSPVASFNHPDRERKPGSIGTPIEGVEMKAVDDDGNEVPQGEPGEIVIRGHNVMKGYWNRPEANEEAIDADGWFRTGDMATVDQDGYFFIVDRKKELIIRGGYNVYPREIEEVLYEHPAVREAAVVGVPHDDLGEEVGAAVALKEGEDASEDELRDYVKEHVAAYKYPRVIWFVDELPKGPTGKILKREIEVPAEVAEATVAEALLIYGDSERSAALRHELRIPIIDPFLFGLIDGTAHVMVNKLERERIAAVLPGASFHDVDDLGLRELRESGISHGELELELTSRAAAAMGVREAQIDREFPAWVADRLRQDGIEVTADPAAFEARRRVKHDWELEGIRRAQRAAEAGMAAAAQALRAASVDSDRLVSDGEPLTAEAVRAAARAACAERAAPAPPDVIVASVHQGFGHEPGSGPLPPGVPIQVDLWPRDEASGCWADMTRTFVVGEVPDAIREQERLVGEALEAVRAATRPGITGRELHAIACDVFEAAGHRTQRTGPGDDPEEGFQFSLGHGVGLEIHEEPSLGMAGHSPLVAGDVLAVEPGLWEAGLGGVRYEDLLLVTEDGCETLTDYPYDLVP